MSTSPHTLQVERIGHLWHVIPPDKAPALLTVGYPRLSSHEQKPQLEPQANRLSAHAGQIGITLDRVASEVASGLNDRRPKLHRLLTDPREENALVGRRDRLARFGVGMVTTMLDTRGDGVPVVEGKEVNHDLVRDMTQMLTCFSARLHGRRSAANRARRAIRIVQE